MAISARVNRTHSWRAIGWPNVSRCSAYARAYSKHPSARPMALAPMTGRMEFRPSIATLKPSPSAPTRFASGTSAPSNPTLPMATPRTPIFGIGSDELHARGVAVDDEAADLVAGLREGRVEARLPILADPGLHAVQPVAVAVAARARGHVRDIGARPGLGEGERADDLAARRHGAVLRALLVRAVEHERGRGQAGQGQDEAGGRAVLRDLLDGQDESERPEPGAADLGRKARSEQPGLAHPLHALGRVAGIAVHLGGVGGDGGLGDRARTVAQVPVLGRELELHQSGRSAQRPHQRAGDQREGRDEHHDVAALDLAGLHRVEPQRLFPRLVELVVGAELRPRTASRCVAGRWRRTCGPRPRRRTRGGTPRCPRGRGSPRPTHRSSDEPDRVPVLRLASRSPGSHRRVMAPWTRSSSALSAPSTESSLDDEGRRACRRSRSSVLRRAVPAIWAAVQGLRQHGGVVVVERPRRPRGSGRSSRRSAGPGPRVRKPRACP